MESVSVRGKAKGQKEKVSVEDYLLLLQSNSDPHLSFPQLNQIIGMHGFKKIFRVPKKILTETVSSMSLVEPARSTIKDHISPGSITATVDDVMADLDDLNWKECCITSVLTLTSWKNATVSPPPPPSSPRNDVVHHQHHCNLQPPPPLALESRAYCDPPPKEPMPKGKSKRSSKGGDGGGASETGYLPVKQVRKKRLSKGGEGGGASE